MEKQLPKRRTSPSIVVSPHASNVQLHRMFETLGINCPRPQTMSPWSGQLPKGSSPSEFAYAYLFSEVFSKFDDGKPSPEKSRVTWERFHAAEEQCRLSNEFLKAERSSRRFFAREDGQGLLWSAAQKIRSILGDFNWDDAETYFGWGPGASTRLPRRRANAAYKYSGRPDSTIQNAALGTACIMRSPLWQEGLTFEEDSGYCNIVAGNRIVTVPKNYKTDRTIAIEPDMNMYVQKGLGGLMRRRLRRAGIDLDDQTRNQRLALVGSFAGTLATIDMSMASDTISHEIVRQLLPPDWYEALGQCRSPVGVLPSGEVISYQKFSSMGNGYTFELETLIFYGLCLAVADLLGEKDHRVAVYGDDIIVPTAMVPKLLELLKYSGFTPNIKKTHVSGPFRESCGKHYFLGHDVTPFYVKRPVRVLTDLFLLHNQIYRWVSRMRWDKDLPRSELRSVVTDLRKQAPSRWRKPRIPDHYGDGAFIGTFDECTPPRAPFGLEGYRVGLLAAVSRSSEIEIKGRMLSALVSIKGSWSPSKDAIQFKEPCGGGVSLPPRTREVMTLVPQYLGMDPFEDFSS